jgi:hypothetical protein
LDGACLRLVCQPAKRTPHCDRVDLVNDALDDVACDLGTVFLEDLLMRTDTLVGTRKSSLSSWRLTDPSGRARSCYESSR